MSGPTGDGLATPRRSWSEAWAVYRHPRVIGMFFLGFAAGLPFLLVFSTLSAWLREMDVARTAIGFFSWVGITYSIKVLWAPVVDRLPLPWLTRRMGRRRSWILLAQLGIAAGLIGMAMTDPRTQLVQLALFAVLVAFSSATQDIAIDAYRIEAVSKDRQGAMSATYVFGYRIALLAAGAGALHIAAVLPWSVTYAIMAALMAIGLATTLVMREPEVEVKSNAAFLEERAVRYLERSAHLPAPVRNTVAWFLGAVVSPFVDFFARTGLIAIAILLFISTYRISDISMGVMANPFYLDLGFTLAQIANISGIFGIAMTIAGSAIGGVLIMRYGIMPILLLGAVMAASTNLLFAWLAVIGPSMPMLMATISADNLSGGLAISAFIAYLSSLTNTAYTATQYALFSSLMTLPGKFIGGFAGLVVDHFGYILFFVYSACIGIPAVLLVLYLIHRMNVDRIAAGNPAEARS
jgi:MFS transporter, PAT family, beta-lactamase induction signal transducer AmpG